MIEPICRVADTVVATQMRTGRFWPWTWGPALFGAAALQVDPERYGPWADAWLEHHVARGPRPDQSDRIAPGLVLAARLEEARPAWREVAQAMADQVHAEPLLPGARSRGVTVTNHLGQSAIGRLYPRSVWVDSLMMLGVFTARWGRLTGDEALLERAATMPTAYAALLHDASGLWHHCWWDGARRPVGPGVFWGRGNGWVVASLPMICEELRLAGGFDADIARIGELLQRTSEALLTRQRVDGWFSTLLEEPQRPEASATSLIGAGWLHAIELGLLDERFAEPALRAIGAVDATIQWRVGPDGLRQWSLPGISGPTIPIPGLTAVGYRAVPMGRDHSYGIAAHLWAAYRTERYGTLTSLGR